MSQTELVRELEGFAFGRKMPMGSRSYQTQKATSEDVALIALAGSTGLEPATSDVTGRRSNQTELTPQAVVRVCFRSRALRGLVYTEVCPARNNFFEKIFRSLPAVTFFNQFLLLAASRLGGPVLRGGVVLDSCWDSAFGSKKTGDALCIPRFCCGYSRSINLVLMIWPSLTSILAMVGPRLPLG